MSSVLLMVQLSVYATTARKTDGLQFSDQVHSFSFSQFRIIPLLCKVERHCALLSISFSEVMKLYVLSPHCKPVHCHWCGWHSCVSIHYFNWKL